MTKLRISVRLCIQWTTLSDPMSLSGFRSCHVLGAGIGREDRLRTQSSLASTSPVGHPTAHRASHLNPTADKGPPHSP